MTTTQQQNTPHSKNQFNLVLPSPVYRQLLEIALRDDITIADAITKCLNIGILCCLFDHREDIKVIIQENGQQYEVKFNEIKGTS